VNFSIVTAWKDLGDPDRLRAFEFVERWWRSRYPSAEFIVGAPEPFTKARGLNAAISAASHDLIVQLDPDVVAPLPQLDLAIELASEHDGLVVPFSDYAYLDRAATVRLHDSLWRGLPTFSEADCQQFGHGGSGLLTVFSRSTWERAHGYDERFGLWGGDDGAFAYACDAFCETPARRVLGLALHSFHERLPQSIPGGEGYTEQFTILAEYRDAAAIGRAAVRELVEKR
jgi:hypothetical protein